MTTLGKFYDQLTLDDRVLLCWLMHCHNCNPPGSVIIPLNKLPFVKLEDAIRVTNDGWNYSTIIGPLKQRTYHGRTVPNDEITRKALLMKLEGFNVKPG